MMYFIFTLVHSVCVCVNVYTHTTAVFGGHITTLRSWFSPPTFGPRNGTQVDHQTDHQALPKGLPPTNLLAGPQCFI